MSYTDKPPLRTRLYVWLSLLAIVGVMTLVGTLVTVFLFSLETQP